MNPEEEIRRQEAAAISSALTQGGMSPADYIDTDVQFKVDVGTPGLPALDKNKPDYIPLMDKDIIYGIFDDVDRERLMKMASVILKVKALQLRLRETTKNPNFSCFESLNHYYEEYRLFIGACRGKNGETIRMLTTKRVEQEIGSNISMPGMPAQQRKKKKGRLGRLIGGD